MGYNILDYQGIIGKEKVDTIIEEAEKLSDKRIVFVSSTFQGGGVAEMLNSIIPLFNKMGISVGWRILQGRYDFFTITKKIHNALQGEELNLSDVEKAIYYETNERFSEFTHISSHDLIVVHDPQPLPLINFYKKNQPWIFRLHIDDSDPYPPVWNYIKTFIQKYDHVIVSLDKYKKRDLNIPQDVIYPAIDPLTLKNRELEGNTVISYLNKYGITLDKPIISQISRFDKWKDPIGVVKIFERVRKEFDCKLILLGDSASDDPEGALILERLKKFVNNSRYKRDIKVICKRDDMLVNCLQRASSVVVQKSLREGFGLTVSEALYKGTPVVASDVGGIGLQVINGKTGFLHRSNDTDGFSESILKLLNDEDLRIKLGEAGKEHVKNNFLITRLMLDYLKLMQKYLLV